MLKQHKQNFEGGDARRRTKDVVGTGDWKGEYDREQHEKAAQHGGEVFVVPRRASSRAPVGEQRGCHKRVQMREKVKPRRLEDWQMWDRSNERFLASPLALSTTSPR